MLLDETNKSFDGYQRISRETAIYPERNKIQGLLYVALGLCGESGEVADQIKKILRDDGSQIKPERLEKIKSEIGDCIWYLAQICSELELNFSDVACKNLEKLFKRKDEGKLNGDGSNR